MVTMTDYISKDELEELKAELNKTSHRNYTTGFFFGKPSDEAQVYDSNTYINEFIYLGTVAAIDAEGLAVIEQKNKFCVGDPIEIMKPNGDNITTIVEAMYDEKGEAVDSCPHPGQEIHLKLSIAPEIFDILRVSNEIAKR